MKYRPKMLILGTLLVSLAASGPGLADTLEIGDPSVTVSTSSISLNGSFTVGSASSGTFAPYSGTAGTLSNIDLLSTTPVNAPLNVPNFVALTGAPNLQIGLNFIAPGVGSISFGCQAASQTCTPSFPALISPADPLGLSPLTFMNTQFGSVASFNVVASGSDTLSPGSTSSTLIGTVTTQYAVPYQTVVSQMISGHPISSSYSATFNAASGATAGALQVGAPTLSISRTGIDFLPASGGTGSFDIGGTSSATFTSLGSALGTIKDLNFATAPINTLGSVPDFITLAGDPDLHFDLTFIVPGVDALCTAPFFSESQTCTYIDPLQITPDDPQGLSPFEIMNLSGGSMLSFEVEGLVTDDLFPGESLPFDAIFATQYDEPFQQFLADDFMGGSMDSSYSATVSIDGSFGSVAVPEPPSLILLGPGVVGLIFLFTRRNVANERKRKRRRKSYMACLIPRHGCFVLRNPFMPRHSLSLVPLATTIGLLLSKPASADVLVSNSSGTGGNLFSDYFGQSVTTPTGGPFDEVTFNFVGLTGAPVAVGTLYVFSSIYSGTPDALSTAGALAVSTSITAGKYNFAPTLSLNSGQKYFFYEDAPIDPGTINGGGPYAGGSYQVTPSATGRFEIPEGDSADFVLSGEPVGSTGVPEPFTLSIFGTGVVGVAAIRRRRKVKQV
jgi:hypothetical protein